MKVLVAATLRSGPAEIGRTMSLAAASGLSVAFTRAAVKAPDAFAMAALSTRSSLRPDLGIARKNWPARCRDRRDTVPMFGALAATREPAGRRVTAFAQ